jgi:hypothetical protein
MAYLDVRIRGEWEGILVVNENREAVGIRCGRKTFEEDLPFNPEDIEDIRPACLWNRLLVELPMAFVFGYPYACLLLLPFLIVAGPFVGWGAPAAAIAAGIIGQVIVLQHPKGYCITGLLLLISTFAMQIMAVVQIIKG